MSQLISIISNSKSDFQVINTVQSILYNLSLDREELDIDTELIKKTGTTSLSFAGAALLVEEILAKQLIKDKRQREEEAATQHDLKRVRENDGTQHGVQSAGDSQFAIKVATPESQKIVLDLIDLYKQMNEEDVLRGLYRTLHSNDEYAIQILEMKMEKKFKLCLQSFDSLIQLQEQSDNKNGLFESYLRQEKREAMYRLNKWEDLVVDIKEIEPRYQHCFLAREETGGDMDQENAPRLLTTLKDISPSDRTFLLKGMLNCDKYWEELRQTTDLLLLNEFDKNLLFNEHPYELSLLSVAMMEFDRAQFYLEKFKDKFITSWKSVKDFSGSITKNEVVSDLLRQQELEEFLKTTRHYHIADYDASQDLQAFSQTIEDWIKKKVASNLDSFGYLSDTYNSRLLFADIIKMRHFAGYSDQLYNENKVNLALNFASGLIEMGYLDTSESILKNAFSIKDHHLSDKKHLNFRFADLSVRSKIQGIRRDIEYISNTMDQSNITIEMIDSKCKKVS